MGGGGGADADLVLAGARVRTLDPARPSAEMVAIRDGLIVAVGDSAEVGKVRGPRTETIDLRGAALTPGLTDSHIHPLWGADLTDGVDLGAATDIDAIARLLEPAVAAAGESGWVRGWATDYAAFTALGGISSAPLDAIVGDRPAVLIFYDLHTAVASSKALELAGIEGPRSFADNSEVVCDAGRPTGELREPDAYELVLEAIPDPGGARRRGRVTERLDSLAAVGLAAAHVMDGWPRDLDLLDELEADGELRMRLVVPFWIRPSIDEAGIEERIELAGRRGARWRGRVAKFFIDGVIEPGTAWLERPDTRGQGTRPHWPDVERFERTVARFAGAGFQCVTHAIGDRAVRATLDAYAAAPDAGSVAHRIEHLEVLGDRELRRCAAERVVPSMQPLHMQWRADDDSDPFGARLDDEQRSRAFRCADLAAAGCPVALGSDWPVAPLDPRVGMAWARLRRTPGAGERRVFEPEQRLSAEQALAGYTSWAAAAVGESDVAGRIAPGFRADLTAFDHDPVAVPADELPDLPIALTVVDGEIVHVGGVAAGVR